MDLIKFTHPTVATDFSQAVPVEGYLGVSWIERYREAGEFTIGAKLSSGLRDFLPLGTFISHTKTFDVMVVEDHYVKEPADEDPILKITGRSIQVLLEQRQVGASINWTLPVMPLTPFEIANNYVYQQVLTLVQTHAQWPICYLPWDDIPNIKTEAPYAPGTLETLEDRVIEPGNVYERTIQLLAVEDLGMKVVRRHSHTTKYHPGWGLENNSLFWIHAGEDVSANVIFSADSGEVDGAEYLWSNKPYKNSAFVYGEHIQMMVELDPVDPVKDDKRRVMSIDASDIDKDYDTATAGQKTAMEDAMYRRGLDMLKSQKQIALTSVDISREKNYTYRTDYDIGDIVMVRGSYGETAKMRVVEFAELEDEESFVAYPTLEFLD